MQVAYHKAPKHEEDARVLRKNDSPSPTSYDNIKSKEFTSGEKSLDKSGRYYKIAKSKKKLFTDDVIALAKKSPGVGEYKHELVIDKGRVARPMRPGRAY